MKPNRETELVKQIESYNLRGKLQTLVEKEAKRRPFRHLPKQFSKGILIGNIAIVPKKTDDSRFVYVIADMVNAVIIYDSINLKQTSIMIAHHLAEGKQAPKKIMELDQHFGSKLFELKNYRRFVKQAEREQDNNKELIYNIKIQETNLVADSLKKQIQDNFKVLFT